MNDLHMLLAQKAYALRVASLEATTAAGSGHPTSCLSAADIVAALFFYAMRFDPDNPDNPNNDRFILSKGHAAPVLYAAWQEVGVLTREEMLSLRQFDSVLEGHPTLRFERSEAATGSLGIGLSVGAGMALSARLDGRDFTTYVLLGDSEVSEGAIWEAAAIAAYYKLENLIAIIDVNRLGQRGQTLHGHDLSAYAKKFSAFGWHTFTLDGHNTAQILAGLDAAHKMRNRPSVIIARTIKGYGIQEIADKNGYHGRAVPAEKLSEALAELQDRCGAVCEKELVAWEPQIPSGAAGASALGHISLPATAYDASKPLATRKAYGDALAALGGVCDRVVVLDAEVKNSTYSYRFEEKFPDRFIECFIAEQNMLGMAIGLANRGKLPFVSTFACFLTRAFDQIRMAAIGTTPLRLSGSHAGVSIGQDGPSQMGLEDLAIMRTLPGSVVLYPCDAVSTHKLVECMANYHDGISYLRTTRADTPIIYTDDQEFHLGGCNVLRESASDVACIVAAGITLHEALKAYDQLQEQGINVAVIDLYSIKPLDVQTLARVGAQAGSRLVTVEDHYAAGGLGEAVKSALCGTGVRVTCLSVDKLPRSGTMQELLAYEGIDAESIIRAINQDYE